jgi:F0F1-type ATP synthase membrane subunit b/b'
MEELLREAISDLTADPVRSLVEVAQSLFLLLALAWVGRRFARRQLATRQARVAGELAAAETAERDGIRLQEEARGVVEGIERQVADILKAARDQAEQERATSLARIETDAGQMVLQARQTVESEKNRVVREASDRLIRLTAEAARRYLDEFLTESQRRALIQKAILESLEEMTGGPARRDAGVA